MPNEISLVFYYGLNYDYHFIIKELENEFEVQFEYIGESKEKYKNFFGSNKKGSYKNSHLVDHLAERIQKINRKVVVVFLNMKMSREI